MRSLTDFTQAIEVLIGQATGQLSVAQLEALGCLLEQLGGVTRATGALKQAFAMDATGVAAVGLAAASGMPQPVSGGVAPFAAPAPAPSALAPTPVAAPAPAQLPPRFTPPPDNVDCEEAHMQRHHPNRIDEIRSSSVIYCNRILYYLGQIGAHVHQIPAGDAALGAKIDDCLLSIECLPGRRPTGGLCDREDDLPAAWQQAYDLMQDLRTRDCIDADDVQQILVKLGDRPGGAHDEPDNSNENLRPAPQPQAMKVESIPAMLPPGSILLNPGQTTAAVVGGRAADLSNQGEHPAVITAAMQASGTGGATVWPAGVHVAYQDLPAQDPPSPESDPAPAAAEPTPATSTS